MRFALSGLAVWLFACGGSPGSVDLRNTDPSPTPAAVVARDAGPDGEPASDDGGPVSRTDAGGHPGPDAKAPDSFGDDAGATVVDAGPSVVLRTEPTKTTASCYPAGHCAVDDPIDQVDSVPPAPPMAGELYACPGADGAQPNFPRYFPDPNATTSFSACGSVPGHADMACCQLESQTDAGAPAAACTIVAAMGSACVAAHGGTNGWDAYACPDAHPKMLQHIPDNDPSATCQVLMGASLPPEAAGDTVFCCPSAIVSPFGAST